MNQYTLEIIIIIVIIKKAKVKLMLSCQRRFRAGTLL